ncbi:MAG: aspartyl-phosphate phosphatase Spo0E family protein [Tumebacillaceae bacterium]
MEERVLVQTIERLREQMVMTAERQGSLVDAHVVAISQQLDAFIVQLQRLKMRRLYQAG